MAIENSLKLNSTFSTPLSTMLSLNLGNLDTSAKRILEISLRPKYMHIIKPWLLKASEDQKRLLLKVVQEMHTLITPSPMAPNDRGLLLPSPTISVDAVQIPAVHPPVRSLGVFATSPLKKSDEILVVVKNSMLNAARITPFRKEKFFKILNKDAGDLLVKWQSGNFSAPINSGAVTALFRSLYQELKSVPKIPSRTNTGAARQEGLSVLHHAAVAPYVARGKSAVVKSTYAAEYPGTALPNWMDA